MGYMHIDNLYRKQAQDILLFNECWALEKIHGSSSNVSWDGACVSYFCGGVKQAAFEKLFNEDSLVEKFTEIFGCDGDITVYGEVYGGSCQKMSSVYGKELRFVAFDVRIGKTWLTVPDAHDIVTKLGLEFVHYNKISTDLEFIDAERDAPSVQSQRNGMGGSMWREGVVLRPLVELTKSNGKRLICKHKRDEYRETKTKRNVSPEQLKVLSNAKEIAEEWVTKMRLQHVLDKLNGPHDMSIMPKLIPAMIEDIKREAEDEIVWDKLVYNAIAKNTARLMKEYLRESIT